MFQRSRRPEPDAIEVVIGPRATLTGNLRCDSSIRIDGVVDGGQIEALGNVIVTEGASATCDVVARNVSIRGNFQGTIRADRAELLDGCRVTGTVYVNSFYIDDGAVLNGELHMQKESNGMAAAPTPNSAADPAAAPARDRTPNPPVPPAPTA